METNSPILWRGSRLLPDDVVETVRQKLLSMDTAKSKKDGKFDGLTSSYFVNSPERPENIFKDTYSDVAKDLMIDLNIRHKLKSFSYWCQVYDGNHPVHDHYDPSTVISFVHFIRPIGEYFFFTDIAGNKTYPKQEKGDIIAFPSWSPHGVDTATGNRRVVIAGNLQIKRAYID